MTECFSAKQPPTINITQKLKVPSFLAETCAVLDELADYFGTFDALLSHRLDVVARKLNEKNTLKIDRENSNFEFSHLYMMYNSTKNQKSKSLTGQKKFERKNLLVPQMHTGRGEYKTGPSLDNKNLIKAKTSSKGKSSKPLRPSPRVVFLVIKVHFIF